MSSYVQEFNEAVEALAQEGFEKFRYTRGGTLEEYRTGAQIVLKGNRKLIEEYSAIQERENRLNRIAFDNIRDLLYNESQDGINQIGIESFRPIAQEYRDDVFNFIDNLSESIKIRFGEYYREPGTARFKDLQDLVYGTIFASNGKGVADSEKHARGMRGIKNIAEAFKTAFTKREVNAAEALMDALSRLKDVFAEAEV